jgi:hypothetical protein
LNRRVEANRRLTSHRLRRLMNVGNRMRRPGRQRLIRNPGESDERRASLPLRRRLISRNRLPESVRRHSNRRIARARRRRRQRQREPRFTTGERIFCLPFGDGEVLESRIEAGREVLVVRFPDYGELTIDPALSLVRKIDASQGL